MYENELKEILGHHNDLMKKFHPTKGFDLFKVYHSFIESVI